MTRCFVDNIRTVVFNNKKFKQNGIVFADTAFPAMFDVEFLSGNPEDLADGL